MTPLTTYGRDGAAFLGTLESSHPETLCAESVCSINFQMPSLENLRNTNRLKLFVNQAINLYYINLN